MKFWGYLHANGDVLVKRHIDFDLDTITEAEMSPFVITAVGVFNINGLAHNSDRKMIIVAALDAIPDIVELINQKSMPNDLVKSFTSVTYAQFKMDYSKALLGNEIYFIYNGEPMLLHYAADVIEKTDRMIAKGELIL